MEKVINKANLDELIGMVRTYLYSGSFGIFEMRRKCEEIIAFADKNFSNTPRIVDLVQTIFSYGGFKPDATNEDVYKVLEVLGWTVKE